MKIQREDIRDACGHKFFARGRDYFESGRVLSLEIEPLSHARIQLLGNAKGSGGQVYQQEVILDDSDLFIDIDGFCSCPMEYNCKHIAALCLAYQDESGRSPDRLKSGLTTAANALQPEVESWLQLLADASPAQTTLAENSAQDFLVYVINEPRGSRYGRQDSGLSVEVRYCHWLKRGNGLTKGRAVDIHHIGSIYHATGYQVLPVDRDIADFLKASVGRDYYWDATPVLSGRAGALALTHMVESGRCYWGASDGVLLAAGESRPVDLGWVKQDNGDFTLRHGLGDKVRIVATSPPMYIDIGSGEVGHIEADGWNGAQLAGLNNAPTVTSGHAELLTNALLQTYPELPLPTPQAIDLRVIAGVDAVPHLTLSSHEAGAGHRPHCVLLNFEYAGNRLPALPQTIQVTLREGEGWLRVSRNLDQERAARQRLVDLGFTDVTNAPRGPVMLMPMGEKSGLESAARWAEFVEVDVDKLRSDGWRIEIDDKFQLRFEQSDWEASIDEGDGGNDWFSLRFDLTLGDERLPLAPLLAPLLETDIENLPATITLPAGGHRYIRLPAERIRPYLTTLKELFNRAPADSDGQFRVSRFDAVTVDSLAARGANLRGAEALRELAARLKDFSGIAEVSPPPGLQADLRPYQQSGLNWLQFLREYRFNGILADDMGLGKTVQTLAHLQIEKDAGRLDKPALVVAPTSLMGNWRRESERFTPDLRVCVLQGSERHARFADMAQFDLLLTTYPLLSRDSAQLQAQQYHSVILDEAQAIKNHRAKMSQLVRQLDAGHRLCLTGTPLENHLGELWALYDFLMPGFLGDAQAFTRFYRTPIEKHGDHARQLHLAHRVQPFLMRRNKDEVATELPPKTEIHQEVRLERLQAELYEGIRVAMDKRVRDAIASQGLARSHITILDALLKLRQVCCDPRLLKLDRTQQRVQSAKLELLMNLLPEQLEEGRRVLLFSQFTSMLGLIETELKQRGIDYSKLTGQTRKRDAAIQRFREGEVNLFLISMKAGGTGLNLTEADTVILYDPWWNPAVETQAVDRAHRIGQDKPVFIYKLIVENSVEEKMLAMQARKRALARGVYADKSSHEATLMNAETLYELFAPMTPGGEADTA
ncbi:MAG: DEAD/DEAH box helicase [Halieaceae bacterium]|nr:DEAD/DEAH box helicase [Halieaceae bacterium]